MPNVLEQIVADKRIEVAAARHAQPLAEVVARCRDLPPTRDFLGALRNAPGIGIIAELKRASPSAGCIQATADPVTVAQCYAAAGANCISVLTDHKYFQGSLADLAAVRAAVSIPLLRKDFILDEYQLYEARAAGADCVLLIAECLPQPDLEHLFHRAGELGLAVLIEIYEPDNLDRVLTLNPPLLGVNNRNLKTMVIDLEHSLRLRPRVPATTLFVSESGIQQTAQICELKRRGVNAVLVGETLMKCGDPERTLRDWIAAAQAIV